MRLIDPTSIKTVREDTEYGGVVYTHHHDGSVDANVKIKSLRLNFTQGAPPDKALVYAIAELEAANREHRLAKEAANPDWVRYTTHRVSAANLRIQEVQ